METISFGPSREPRRRRRRRGWPPRRGWRRWRAWLIVSAAAALAVAAVVLAGTGGHARRPVSAPQPSAWPMPPLLGGVPARAARTDLFLGGENFWRVGSQPRPVAAGLLLNGLSPLLPHGHGAEVDQLAPVPGGVVAHIGDISTGITYGALGRVVFIPAANAPARVIARATVIAVAPGGLRVWVQTGIQSVPSRDGQPANSGSPTWAVDLAGHRVSPVLQLPLGLVGATESGPLTQNLGTKLLQLWDGATGRAIRMSLPADANFVAAGDDRVISWACGASCLLHVTDLGAGADAVVPLPDGWLPTSQTYPQSPASFDPSGRRLVLPLDRVDSAGDVTAQDLFVAGNGMLRMIPGGPLLPPALVATQSIVLAGSWDRQGLVWELAMNPYSGYYQLGFWAGAGPLRTFAPAQGSPVTLSAPGPG